MAQVIFKRGHKNNLDSVKKIDGQLSITTDEGRLYYDFLEDGEVKRKALYPGKLTIGDLSFDGTADVSVPVYNGEVEMVDHQ